MVRPGWVTRARGARAQPRIEPGERCAPLRARGGDPDREVLGELRDCSGKGGGAGERGGGPIQNAPEALQSGLVDGASRGDTVEERGKPARQRAGRDLSGDGLHAAG